MATEAEDLAIRLAAFRHLSGLKLRFGDTVRREVLEKGFEYDGHVIRLIGPQGIFKPSQLDLPLTVTTAPRSPRKPRPYEDSMQMSGLLRYCYRGTDPAHRDNAGLRAVMRTGKPLVYLHGTISPKYVPVFPVFVVGDDPASLNFHLQAADADQAALSGSAVREVSAVSSAERQYRTREIEQRLHQAMFRDRVLDAYRSSCSVCHLRHEELLDAAHIKPDADGGMPVVSNGLALCKLHHAAYDSNILGVRPDLKIEINARVLEEIDGPMLRHGLQGMHGEGISVPRKQEWRPDLNAVQWRYERFRAAQ